MFEVYEAAVVGAATLGTAFLYQERIIFGRPKRLKRLKRLGPNGSYTVQRHELRRPDGAVLEGWSANPTGSTPERIVVYLGGRNEHVGWVPDIASHMATGTAAFYSFNNRSHGRSTGAPTEGRAKLDAREILRFVEAMEGDLKGRLVLVGRSLGTSVAAWLAAEAKPAGIVLLSPFSSLEAVVSRRFMGAGRLLLPFLRCGFRSDEVALESLPGWKVVMLAQRDRMVPHEDSMRMVKRLRGEVELVVVPGTNHCTLPRAERTILELVRLLEARGLDREQGGGRSSVSLVL